MEILNSTTLKPVTDAVTGHGGVVSAVSWSPDSSLLLSSGSDGTIQFWDAANLRPLGSPDPLGRDGLGVVAWYLPDGNVTGLLPPQHGPITRFVLPGTPARWAADACAFVGGGLSAADWKRYLPELSFRDTCPSAGPRS